ncbi:MAG: PP2C family protein-serine/threonine phosphatase [bacterium]
MAENAAANQIKPSEEAEQSRLAAAPPGGVGLPGQHRGVVLLAADAGEAARWWPRCVAPQLDLSPGATGLCPPETLTTAIVVSLSELVGRSDRCGVVPPSEACVVVDDGRCDGAWLVEAAWAGRSAAIAGGVAVIHPNRPDRAELAAQCQSAGLSVRYGGLDEATASFVCGMLCRGGMIEDLSAELELARLAKRSADRWLAQLDEELHVAGRLQRELLPGRMPDLPGMQLATLCNPLWHVSGDLYRVVSLGPGRAAFLLVDAMGHGLGAAMHAVVIAQGLLPPLDDEDAKRQWDPAEALARINTDLMRCQGERARFASAVCGTVDACERTVRVAVAGHQAPLVIRGGREGFVEMEVSGPVLGVFSDATFDSASIRLEPGDTLTAYTDGLDEMFGTPDAKHPKPNPEAAKAELARLFACPHTCLQGHVDRLRNDLQQRPASLHRADDLTLLAIRAAA